MEPVKLRLINKNGHFVSVGEHDMDMMSAYHGSIEVYCHDGQSFAEIVQRLLESHLAVAAVQQAIHCLQMAKSPADRVADLRMLQDVHFKMTGWHFDSAAKPAAIEGVEPSSGSVSMEKAREAFGKLDPKKIEVMFPGMPGTKIRFLTDEKVPPGEIVVDFHPEALKE